MKRRASYNTDSDYSDSDKDDLSAASSAQHEQLTTELQGRIKYDDPSVFRRLRIDEEEAAVIDHCHERYQEEQERHLKMLLQVTGQAEEALRTSDAVQDSDEKGRKRKRKKAERDYEKKMYAPLENIFTFLQNFGRGNAGALREFTLAASTTVQLPPARAAEAYTPGLTAFRPDFNLLDIDEVGDGPFWDKCVGFAEIKVNAENNRRPRDESTTGTVKDAILQCANYARYHMAFRPFWNFSITLLITGTDFRIMIVDHDGVVLSPIHSIYDDGPPPHRVSKERNAKTFVRVVRALTQRLTDYQLGQDPSVTPVTRDELKNYLQMSSIPDDVRANVRSEGENYYPSYRLSRFGNERRTWCTVGPPIWTALSLIGRGTEVWRVLELLESDGGWTFEGNIHVLKSAWRNPLKLAETEVYKLIEDFKSEDPHFPPGIATHLYGNDVFYCEDALADKWVKITIAHIRGYAEDPENPSKVLHRILLPRVGEPLWKYTDELQLLNAFRSIIEAHKYLCNKGILHRDISPGNMLLWPNGDDSSGFLTDYDMAHVDRALRDHLVVQEAISTTNRNLDPSGRHAMKDDIIRSSGDRASSRPGGVAITGTLQFMALELLQGIKDKEVIQHTQVHDLESIAYVLGYTVLRRLINTPLCPETLNQGFCQYFGGMSVQDIINQRIDRQPLSWISPNKVTTSDSAVINERFAFISKHVSRPLGEVLFGLEEKFEAIRRASRREGFTSVFSGGNMKSGNEEPMSHDFFLGSLKQAIDDLNQQPSLVKRFNPEQETLRPLSMPQSGSDKPSKKKLRQDK
ncbi:hypothetical protein DAEQUDRAFT_757301 [Daedalea quercina L-15889]|uniref:Protein kinase domain-containing protein n=1 Tax=Daedalea quercina L-15889 TaxID=1314783 RepID=A0A165Q216_9APHY|nr:hypothetical protein DAEQUDRAFT_757301 [Daedalea quercina L-15889]